LSAGKPPCAAPFSCPQVMDLEVSGMPEETGR
jgi:hypothetical protein